MVAAMGATRTPSVELFEKALDYLNRTISLLELHTWMGRHTTWLMTAPPDDGTELAGFIELNLAEIEAGRTTEDDLRREIEEYLTAGPTAVDPTYTFELGTSSQATSSSVTVKVPAGQV